MKKNKEKGKERDCRKTVDGRTLEGTGRVGIGGKGMRRRKWEAERKEVRREKQSRK